MEMPRRSDNYQFRMLDSDHSFIVFRTFGIYFQHPVSMKHSRRVEHRCHIIGLNALHQPQQTLSPITSSYQYGLYTLHCFDILMFTMQSKEIK